MLCSLLFIDIQLTYNILLVSNVEHNDLINILCIYITYICVYIYIYIYIKYPLKKEMATNPVVLPGEFHGQRSLAGFSPWGCKASDTLND